MKQLIGLVLLGGRSRRMGRDKAFLSYHQQPQWRHCVELLSQAGIDKVLLSGQADQRSHYPKDIGWLSDPHPDQGPMGGILQALRRHPGQAVLSMPVDMPALRAESIQSLITARKPKEAATAFALPNPSILHPLLLIWEPKILPAMLSAWEEGQRSPRKFLQTQSVHLVSGLSEAEALNVNRPEDWQDQD